MGVIVGIVIIVLIGIYISWKKSWFSPFLVKTIAVNSSIVNTKEENEFLKKEKINRRIAFTNTEMFLTEDFFQNTDMNNSYFITLVYTKKKKEVVLSSRYYYNFNKIQSIITGEDFTKNEWFENDSFDQWKNKKVFLSDRLAANKKHILFEKYRNRIFEIFYSEIIKNNSDGILLLMARNNHLLTKYLRIGFTICGSTIHNQKKHWIVQSELRTSKLFIKKNFLRFTYLFLKN